MRLSGQLTGEFQAALMDAFPTRDRLEQMVKLQLSRNLSDFASNAGLETVTFQLIQEFARQDKILELVEGALQANPNNQKLKPFVDKLKTDEINSQDVLIKSSDKKLSPIERLTLMKTLNSLPSQQLDELIVSVEPPGGVIPPSNAPQGDRTAALIRWAESPGGKGLELVQEILQLITPN